MRNDLAAACAQPIAAHAAAPFRTGFKYGAIAFALAVSRTSNARTARGERRDRSNNRMRPRLSRP
ncbi:hypothetical protein WK52_15695 [Burkholderia multivorans]|nr:hypothetical protein WK52_15695 [Burkholderia multivorans]PRH12177.1 hypothetical protein C6T61_03060 [Burkholderia multivorans]